MIEYAWGLISVVLLVVVILYATGVIKGPTPTPPPSPPPPAPPSEKESITYFVTADGSDNQGTSGTNPSEAFATLQRALSASENGDLIQVGPGLFSTQAELVVSKGVTIRSLEGRDATLLQADPTAPAHRMVSLTHGGALLSGFTIAGGRAETEQGGNVFIDNYATIEDCWCRDGIADQYGGNIYLEYGTARRCEASGGDALISSHGAGNGIYVRRSGVVDSCFAHDNLGGSGAGIATSQFAQQALVVNCTITRNYAYGLSGTFAGGFACNSTCYLRNCVIYGNDNAPSTGIDAGFYLLADASNVVNNCIGVMDVQFGVAPTSPTNLLATDPLMREDGSIPIGSPADGTGHLAVSGLDFNGVPRPSMLTPSMGGFVPN